LDSTTARFWFKEDNAKRKIAAMLEGLNGGKIMSKENLKICKANFNHTKYGELIWIADGGILILPNFWQGNSPVRGMHGYLPKVEDNCAAFMLLSPTIDRMIQLEEPCEMVDIFPTILDLLNLPTPESNEGISVLRK
jgi:hypothetical protein